ncbi:MAG TPA: glycosyltransferase [Candidatus Borkfalkia faecipullorum]|uniref:Glycosyltransferase n=1 Tax=Candidatus Borkfalkia faecipullorum TaxID=2838510 RepID=A0A9D2AFS1_9FIRM|nr:glycosyltransferase [Candidatus Borkfalkia faecipullorum]
MRICAVIITYNRTNCIENLLKALIGQTYKTFDIFIFDVACDGDTELKAKKYLNHSTKYIKAKKDNVFESYLYALESVYEKYDWIWMLHDDVVPDKNALHELVSAISKVKKASFFTSALVTSDNKPSYTPALSPYSIEDVGTWGEKLEYSLVRISKASFISTFINTDAIKMCGLPTSKLFYKENSDYLSNLIGQYGAAYLVGKSKVILKKIEPMKSIVPQKIKICAIVVTYNRKEMLVECIKALQTQKYNSFDILIVDNASTDGTKEYIADYLKENNYYINTGANFGGSGGFYYGMKYAYEHGYDWLWIMDDDVIPTPAALGELVSHLKYVKTLSFLASAVYSKDNKALNTPEISRYSTNGYLFWYDKLEYGMVSLAHATFVSLLINRKAIEKCGLPCKDYFIWGDDTEYTMRIIGRFGAAYMVGSSKVYHLRGSSSALNIKTEKSEKRILMYYNLIRNTLLNARTYSGQKACKDWIRRYRKDCIAIALSKLPYRKLKIKTILSAINDFKKGKYAAEAFKNRYQIYGQEKAVLNFIGLDEIAELIKSQFGYTVVLTKSKVSIFTMFERVPAYIKEYNYKDISAVTQSEIKKDFFEIIKPIVKNQFIVIDLRNSCNAIVKFTRGNKSFNMNYTSEFANDLNNGKLEILCKNYDYNIMDTNDYSEKYVADIVERFAINISQIYNQNKIVFIKYDNINKNDMRLYNSSIYTNKLVDMLCEKLPLSKILVINSNDTNESTCTKLKELLSN